MRKIFVGMFVACLVLSALYYQPVRAADWYVDETNGRNSYNCQSWATACRTITHVLNDHAGDGDTIHVAAGLYKGREAFPLSIDQDNLTLVGAGRDSTTISAEGSGENVIDIWGENVTIRGFTIKKGEGGWGRGVVVEDSNATIMDCIIEKNDGDGIHLHDSATIRVNIIRDNNKGDEESGGGIGIDIEGTGTILIDDNDIYKNAHGIYFEVPANPTIQWNSIHENYDDGIESNEGGNPTITHNDIWGNEYHGIHFDGGSPIITNNTAIRDNGKSHEEGSGIYLHDVSATISNNPITDNRDAGIYAYSSTGAISENTIEDNKCGIYNDNSNLTIEHNIIQYNGIKESEEALQGTPPQEMRTYSKSYYDRQGKAAPIQTAGSIVGQGNMDKSGIVNDDVSKSLIEHNTIQENKHRGIINFNSNLIINANAIRNNGMSGIRNNESSPTITNNLLVGNGIYGINNNPNCSPAITNNTIVSNNRGGVYILEGSNPALTNNIIVGNGKEVGQNINEFSVEIVGDSEPGYGIYADASYSGNTYNDVWNNGPMGSENYGGSAVQGAGEISQDPLFVSSPDDLHLQGCTSPAVNTGSNSAPQIPTNDFDENLRIVCVVDMGAFEVSADAKCLCPQQTLRKPISLPSLLPTAQNNISNGNNLLKQAEDLLTQAQQKGADCTKCEKLINEAKELLTKSKTNITNPIYANNLALQALEKLKQAIDCLKALLG
jgi:parallel beta-helix repeat protein